LIVEAYYVDVIREPRLIDADPHYRGRPLADVREELVDEYKCLMIAGGRPCQFLQSDCRCAIHPTRPTHCVAFEAGDEQCQEARLAQGLPPLLPVPSETLPLFDTRDDRAAR
jgi:Fe-S-cluster containining protein